MTTGEAGRQLRWAVEDFLIQEASLLDEGRVDEWLALFSSTGRYWVPEGRHNIDPSREVSIIYDDKSLLAERVWRYKSGLAFAQEPRSRTSHLVANVQIDAMSDAGDAGPVVGVSARFVVTEFRRDAQCFYAGRYLYHLRESDASFLIELKKVELVNTDGRLGNVSCFL